MDQDTSNNLKIGLGLPVILAFWALMAWVFFNVVGAFVRLATLTS